MSIYQRPDWDIPTEPQVLRKDHVARMVGVSKSTIERWTRLGKFPKPIRLGTNSIAWRRRDLERWLAERPDAAD